MRMTRLTTALMALLPTTLFGCDELSHEVDSQDASIAADGIVALHVDVDAGDLFVIGDAAATTITANVTLRSAAGSDRSDNEVLERMTFNLGTAPEGLATLTVALPDGYPRYSVDTEVVLPAGMSVDIIDGSGDATIADVGALNVIDGSGELTIQGTAGHVVVEDGSGDLRISDVAGDVEIQDGSGDISVSQVSGEVVIWDGSGDIDVHDAGDVDVREDSSGDVRAW